MNKTVFVMRVIRLNILGVQSKTMLENFTEFSVPARLLGLARIIFAKFFGPARLLGAARLLST